jgi:hypothetical protein
MIAYIKVSLLCFVSFFSVFVTCANYKKKRVLDEHIQYGRSL